MVLCGTKNGSSMASLWRTFLSTFIFKSVYFIWFVLYRQGKYHLDDVYFLHVLSKLNMQILLAIKTILCLFVYPDQPDSATITEQMMWVWNWGLFVLTNGRWKVFGKSIWKRLFQANNKSVYLKTTSHLVIRYCIKCLTLCAHSD